MLCTAGSAILGTPWSQHSHSTFKHIHSTGPSCEIDRQQTAPPPLASTRQFRGLPLTRARAAGRGRPCPVFILIKDSAIPPRKPPKQQRCTYVCRRNEFPNWDVLADHLEHGRSDRAAKLGATSDCKRQSGSNKHRQLCGAHIRRRQACMRYQACMHRACGNHECQEPVLRRAWVRNAFGNIDGSVQMAEYQACMGSTKHAWGIECRSCRTRRQDGRDASG